MHVDPWKLEVLIFVLTWWWAFALAILAGIGYGLYRLVRRMLGTGK